MSAPPRSARPWLALLAGVVLVAAVLGLLWLTDDDGAALDGRGSPVTLDDPADGSGELPDPGVEGMADSPVPLTADGRPTIEITYDDEELGSSGSLAVIGRVVDGTKQPLEDIEVNLFAATGEFLDATISNEKGLFSFDWDGALLPGFSLGTEPHPDSDADDPGSLGMAAYVHGGRWMPGDEPVEVELAVFGAPRLVGHVVDGVTGEPIDFADVQVVSTHASYVDEWQDAYTEEDGSFAVSIVDLPRTGLIVRALDLDNRVVMQGPFDLGPGEERYLRLELFDPLTLTGKLLDASSGQPLENGEVMVLPMHPNLDNSETWDLTFEDGSFTIEWIENPRDQLWLFAEADEHSPVLVRVPPNQRSIDVRLHAFSTISGRVVSTDEEGEDEPVPGATVRFVLSGPSGLVEDYEDGTFSDDDGSYDVTFELAPPEAAMVIVEAEGYAGLRAPLRDLVALGVGGVAYELDLRLVPLPQR